MKGTWPGRSIQESQENTSASWSGKHTPEDDAPSEKYKSTKYWHQDFGKWKKK